MVSLTRLILNIIVFTFLHEKASINIVTCWAKTYRQLLHFDNIVEKIFQNADKRCCSYPETDK